MKEKEYKITFVDDYVKYKEWGDGGDEYWKNKIEMNPEQLKMCEKYYGKTIRLSEIPGLVKEVGECVISEDEIEIYNGWRE